MLGAAIQTKRTERNISRAQLAKQVGVSSTYIYQLEKGLRDVPSALVIVRLAQALNMEVTELLALVVPTAA